MDLWNIFFVHVYDSKAHTGEVFLDYFAPSCNGPVGWAGYNMFSIVFSVVCLSSVK